MYRLAGVDAAESTSWRRYAVAAVAFNVLGVVVVLVIVGVVMLVRRRRGAVEEE